MTTLPLRPECAPVETFNPMPGRTVRPTREELFQCLRLALEHVESRLLGEGFPRHAVFAAMETAGNAGVDAICKGQAETMTPQAQRKWLWVVARHAVVTFLRRKRPVSLPDEDVIPSPLATSFDPHGPELVREAVRRLPLHARAIIVVVYFKGLNRRAAADRLGMPETTFRRRHAWAIRLLRGIVQRLFSEF